MLREKENALLTLAYVAAAALILAAAYDYYYDLNDDSAIKDILSGVYTGTPNGHNIQMLYALAAFLALPYCFAPTLPWYGMFLWLCNFGCFYLIGARSLDFCGRRPMKAALLAIEGACFAALSLWDLIFVQYTVVSGLLAVTAVFLFYTSKGAPGDWKGFFKKNCISIALALVSFAVRSEMFLLLFPLLCLAGLFCWSKEEKPLQKQCFLKYGSVVGAVLAGMACLLAIDGAAYGSSGWKEFGRYFNARTQIYDFTGIPPYEENEQFYKEAGLAKAQKQLLDNYNFGLDERMDSALLEKVADYALASQKPPAARAKEALYLYWHRLRNEMDKDYPWNLFVLMGYLLAVASAAVPVAAGRGRSCLWKLGLLFLFRSALWLFLLYRGRVVERITHPLLLMELVLLVLLLGEAKQRYWPYVCGILFGLMAALALSGSIERVNAEYARRAQANAAYAALRAYCREHGDNYYFLDVYSSVAYSEKMFAQADNSLANYDLMGGWVCKSPLYRQKLAQFGLTDMESALEGAGNVYVLCRLDRPEADMGWLAAYYADKGKQATVRQIDTIQGVFGVYQIDVQ